MRAASQPPEMQPATIAIPPPRPSVSDTAPAEACHSLPSDPKRNCAAPVPMGSVASSRPIRPPRLRSTPLSSRQASRSPGADAALDLGTGRFLEPAERQ